MQKCKAAIAAVTSLEITMAKKEMDQNNLEFLPALAKAVVMMSKGANIEENTLVHTLYCKLAQNAIFYNLFVRDRLNRKHRRI